MPVIMLCLLTSNKNHLFCLLVSNKSIIFAHVHVTIQRLPMQLPSMLRTEHG